MKFISTSALSSTGEYYTYTYISAYQVVNGQHIITWRHNTNKSDIKEIQVTKSVALAELGGMARGDTSCLGYDLSSA